MAITSIGVLWSLLVGAEVPRIAVTNEAWTVTPDADGSFVIEGTNRYSPWPLPVPRVATPPKSTVATTGGYRSEPTLIRPNITAVAGPFVPDDRVRPLHDLSLQVDRDVITSFPAEINARLYGQDATGAVIDLSESGEISWTYEGVLPSTVLAPGHLMVTEADIDRSSLIVRCFFRGMTFAQIIWVKIPPIDTDGDGLPDTWERLYGFNPEDIADANLDADGDGLIQVMEYALGTNPLRVDTDNDALIDSEDDAPLIPEAQAPVITLVAPLPDARHEPGAGLVISAEVSDNAHVDRVEAQLNGQWYAMTEPSPGRWERAIGLPLITGAYVLRVRAYDVAGNRAETPIILDVRDSIGPVLTWHAPATTDPLVGHQLVMFHMEAIDTSGIKRLAIYDDEHGAMALAESTTGLLLAAVAAPAGPVWRVRALAEDKAGNITTVTRDIALTADALAPHIMSVLPEEGAVVPANTPFEVIVAASDVGSGLDTLDILVGSTSTGLEAFGDGRRVVSAPAVSGSFQVLVQVRDRAGNQATALRTLMASDAERDPPVIAGLQPTAGSTWLHHQDIPVAFTVTDASALAAIDVTLDGVVVGSSLQPSVQMIVRAPGVGTTARIGVMARDVHGNAVTQEIDLQLLVDDVAPQIMLTPSDGSRLAPGQSVALVMASADLGGVASQSMVIAGEAIVLDASGRAVWQAPQEPGEITVAATATDRSGNSTVTTVTWMVDAGIHLRIEKPYAGQEIYAGVALPLEVRFSAEVNVQTISYRINGGESGGWFSYSNPPGLRRFNVFVPTVDVLHVVVFAKTWSGVDLVDQVILPVHPWPGAVRIDGTVLDVDGQPLADQNVWAPGADIVRSDALGRFSLSLAKVSPTPLYLGFGQVSPVPVFAWTTQRGAEASGAGSFALTAADVARGYREEAFVLTSWDQPGADLGEAVTDTTQPLSLTHPWQVGSDIYTEIFADARGLASAGSPVSPSPFSPQGSADGRVREVNAHLEYATEGAMVVAHFRPYAALAQVYWRADDRGSVATWVHRDHVGSDILAVSRLRFRPDGRIDVVYPGAMDDQDEFATYAFGSKVPGRSWNGVVWSVLRERDADYHPEGFYSDRLWSNPEPGMRGWHFDGEYYLIDYELSGMDEPDGQIRWGPFAYFPNLQIPMDAIEASEDEEETASRLRSYIDEQGMAPAGNGSMEGSRGAVVNVLGAERQHVHEDRVPATTQVVGRILDQGTAVADAIIHLGNLSTTSDVEGRFRLDYDRPAMAVTSLRWYVDAAAPPGGDGRSWVSAFASITTAAAQAKQGDEIWVAAGIYLPTPSPGVIDPRLARFHLPSFTQWKGGFTPGATRAEEADPWRTPSILSADIGILGDASDNAYQIAVWTGLVDFDGFVFRGARGFGNDGACSGGGGFARCWFDDNQTPLGRGGALYANGSVSCVACVFTNNRARSGGAIAAGHATIEACIFLANAATETGGALRILQGGDVYRATFSGNAAASAASLDATGHTFDIACAGCIFDDVPGAVLGLSGNRDVVQASYWRDASFGTALLAQAPIFQDALSPSGADGIWATADDGVSLSADSPGIDVLGAATYSVARYADLRGLLMAGVRYDVGAYEVGATIPHAFPRPEPWWEDSEVGSAIVPLRVEIDGVEVFVVPAIALHGANIITIGDIDLHQPPPGSIGRRTRRNPR